MPRKPSAGNSREPKISLLPEGPHTRYNVAFARMAVAFAAAGKHHRDLDREREQTYWALRDPFHEHAIGSLYEWWDYDQPKLLGRRGGHYAAKPRIVLKAYLTKPGNLAVEWMPDSRSGSDWNSFHRSPGFGPYRPSNELMFIRKVREINPNPKPNDPHGPTHDRLFDAHLIACLGAAIDELEVRLKISFDVSWETAFVIDWAPQPDDYYESRNKGREMLGWHIEDVSDGERREEQAELGRLLQLTQRDAEGFIQLLVELEPDLTLERLRQDASPLRLRKKLQQRGIDITPAPLARLVKLLESHHAELMRPLWRTVGGGTLQVVK